MKTTVPAVKQFTPYTYVHNLGNGATFVPPAETIVMSHYLVHAMSATDINVVHGADYIRSNPDNEAGHDSRL